MRRKTILTSTETPQISSCVRSFRRLCISSFVAGVSDALHHTLAFSGMHNFRLFLAALLWSGTFGAPAEDLVTDLPGLEFPVNFNQYSGYLNGTEGRKLHYWFVESKSDPTTDPLVLWLNGGPGCSSLMGFLTELGPFRVNEDGSGSLVPNVYSWNTAANVIFLESPACVGFSYDENNNCATGDIEVAQMNYIAVKEFFQKFPEYEGREFYITGESYGGIYVPTLSVQVVEGNSEFPINFQGYAIGNGLLSYENNDNSLLFFGYYHAILGQTEWDNLVATCCDNGIESQLGCNFTGSTELQCELLVASAFNVIYNGGLNIYGLYNDCIFPTEGTKPQRGLSSFDADNLFRRIKGKYSGPELRSDPPCTDNSLERNYLNTPEVREALHIPDEAPEWDVCSDEVGYYYSRDYGSSVPQIAFLQQNGIKGLIYNGDTDMACNVLGNEWDIRKLGLDPLDDYNTWEVGGQVAGFFVPYENLDFVTVRGSGHMVPEDKPEEALHMFTAFLNGEPY